MKASRAESATNWFAVLIGAAGIAGALMVGCLAYRTYNINSTMYCSATGRHVAHSDNIDTAIRLVAAYQKYYYTDTDGRVYRFVNYRTVDEFKVKNPHCCDTELGREEEIHYKTVWNMMANNISDVVVLYQFQFIYSDPVSGSPSVDVGSLHFDEVSDLKYLKMLPDPIGVAIFFNACGHIIESSIN